MHDCGIEKYQKNFPFLSLYIIVKRPEAFVYRRSGRLLLRRQDSNVRPPGYEPGELPTAPLRDLSIHCLYLYFR